MIKIFNGREHFFQWDLNQKVIVNEPTANEVHFCNRTDECSLVCEVYEEDGLRVADVPNILLQNDWDIRAYIYCTNHTKIEKRFEVKRRSKPADYIYTETEIKDFSKLEDRVDMLETGKLNAPNAIERGGVNVITVDGTPQGNTYPRGYLLATDSYSCNAGAIPVYNPACDPGTVINSRLATGTPLYDWDAVNKSYVDEKIGEIGGGVSEEFVNNAANQALEDAKAYADGLADNYDAVGSASAAETASKAYTDTKVGNIETALDDIIAIQEALIGGEA